MKKFGLWISLMVLALLASCGHPGHHHGDGQSGLRPNEALVSLAPVGSGFIPVINREPFIIERAKPGEPVSATWRLPAKEAGSMISIEIKRVQILEEAAKNPGGKATAAQLLGAVKLLGEARGSCPLVKPDGGDCACKSAQGQNSATCSFKPGFPTVFKYDICIERPAGVKTCLDPTGMIN